MAGLGIGSASLPRIGDGLGPVHGYRQGRLCSVWQPFVRPLVLAASSCGCCGGTGQLDRGDLARYTPVASLLLKEQRDA